MQKIKTDIFKDIFISILILTISTIIGLIFKKCNFHETNIVVVYIFSVLLISRFTLGYVYGIICSIASLLLFNWFFTEPYYTFKVDDLTYFITFAIMMFTSIVTSALTTKVKKVAMDAKEREHESIALYQMTNHLTDSEDEEKIAEITIKTTSEILSCNTSCIIFDELGDPKKTFLQIKDDGKIIRRELDNVEEFKQRMYRTHGFLDVTIENYYYPIFGKKLILAVLCIPTEVGEQMNELQKRMIHSIIESASLALTRLRSIQAQARSREEAFKERYRGNLLRAISHDIRTPLAGIMGTSEMLMDKTVDNEALHTLAKDINKDAEWLHRFVENILNLTKLQDGKLVNKQLEAVEEVIGASLMQMEKRIPGRNISIEMPENVVMVPMDASLISQVLINLLDNAIKHTDVDGEISIIVNTSDGFVNVTVADRGTGISKIDLPRIFQIFYTTSNKSPDSKRGVGLGLAICQSIIEAHDGKIYAENREGGGAAFTFKLPIGGEEDDE